MISALYLIKLIKTSSLNSNLLGDLFMATLKKEKEKGSYTEKALVTSLIQQVFSHCKVGSINITDRILTMFRAKLSRMKKAKGKAHRGGRQLKVLKEQIEHADNSIWKFKIYYIEVDNILTKTENEKLKGEKRKLEDELEKTNHKIARLEEKVDKAEKSTQAGTRGPDQNKNFCDYTKRHQERIRGLLKSDCENSLTFLGIHDFVATEVKVFNFSTDEFETFHLVDSILENSVASEEDKDIINLLFFTKDRLIWHIKSSLS